MKKLKPILLVFCSVLVLSSCEDFLDKAPDNLLVENNNYTDKSNVYATFAGLFTTLQDCAAHHILLSELLGDLVYPTGNANNDIKELFEYEFRQSNPLIDPAPYYKIVMNSNDFLRNVIEYNANYPGVVAYQHYREMIAAAVTMRTWAYLNLGKLFGGAYYYDYSMTGDIDFSQLTWLEFDVLIPTLISFMNVGVDNMNAFTRINIDKILFGEGSADMPQWRRMSMNPDMVMMELYLWNKDYQNAAKTGIDLIAGRGTLDYGGDNLFTMNRYQNANYFNIFKYNQANIEDEGLTMVFFDKDQRQVNILQDYFSTIEPNSYYLTFSAAAVLNYQYPADRISEETGNTVAIDRRTNMLMAEGGANLPVIKKYHYDKTIKQATDRNAPIHIYRAAEIYLMLAEALTALGNYDAADALLNEGMKPYYADQRFSPPFDAPIYDAAKLSFVPGIRGRVGANYVHSTISRFLPSEMYEEGSAAYETRRKVVLDSLIAAETGRELAFEGKRWFTMMRIARNTDNPEFLAKIIPQKYANCIDGILDQDKYDKAYLYLKDPENWFVKYDFAPVE